MFLGKAKIDESGWLLWTAEKHFSNRCINKAIFLQRCNFLPFKNVTVSVSPPHLPPPYLPESSLDPVLRMSECLSPLPLLRGRCGSYWLLPLSLKFCEHRMGGAELSCTVCVYGHGTQLRITRAAGPHRKQLPGENRGFNHLLFWLTKKQTKKKMTRIKNLP